jgi:hypothetical protein
MDLIIGIAIGAFSVIALLLVGLILTTPDPDQQAKDSWKRRY